MKLKILLCLALVLSGLLPGCKPRHIPSPPSADQVREWAGFPAGFQLQATLESMTNADNESQSMIGKPIWGCTYANPKRSLASFEIIVCKRGTLWGTNRTQALKMVEKQVALMRSLKSPDEFVKKAFQIIPLPNGRKAYFTVLGFGPGGTGLVGFSYEHDYDLMIGEDFDAEHGRPAEKQIKNPISPANDLPVIFGKVETFLDAQQNVRGEP
jgi:hypothetical protein